MQMSFKEAGTVTCGDNMLMVYSNERGCWLSKKEVIWLMMQSFMRHSVKKEDGEILMPMDNVLRLLMRVEMEDFSLTPLINSLLTIRNEFNEG